MTSAPAACVMCASTEVASLAGPLSAWRYHRCGVCGHMWLVPAPTPDELRTYYNGAYQVPRERYRSRARAEFPRIRALLAESGMTRGSMLELGCSYGEMLACFQADGWRVTGVELDARACAEASRRVGSTVYCGDLTGFHASTVERFDVVTAFHVIEHVVDFRAFLERALALLNPGGLLLMKTPNAASVASRVAAGWWEWAAPPEHVHLFSARSMTIALRAAGAGTVRMTSRRGDANGLLFEALRSSAKRMSRRPAGSGHYSAGVVPLSLRPWYRAVRAADALLESPLDALLSAASHDEQQLGAELTVLVRPREA